MEPRFFVSLELPQATQRLMEETVKAATQQPNVTPRPLNVIAADITRTWKNVYFGAVPYLQAMRSLSSIDGMYGADSAHEVVLYFLANAQTWRGEDARRIKAELKALAGIP